MRMTSARTAPRRHRRRSPAGGVASRDLLLHAHDPHVDHDETRRTAAIMNDRAAPWPKLRYLKVAVYVNHEKSVVAEPGPPPVST